MALVDTLGVEPNPELSGELVNRQNPHKLIPVDGYNLPDYPDEIDESSIHIRRYPDLDCRYGRFWLREFQTTSGTQYENVIGIPKERRSIHKAALWTPAWWTDHRAGYNTEMAIDAMEQGYTAFILSAELNDQVPLSLSAHNMHKAFANTSNFDEYSTDKAILLGDSRGAEIGFGFLAYAAKNRLKVLGGQLVDPCCAHKIDFTINKRLISELIQYEEHKWEPVSLLRQIGRLSLAQIPHYSKTLRLSPDFIRQQIRIAEPIFSGEAGDLARLVPDDQDIDILLFTRSAANHTEEWEQIFVQKAGNTKRRTGTHLSIANPRTRQTKREKLAELRDYTAAA